MQIEKITNDNGGTTEIIHLTDEEQESVDFAVDEIIRKYIEFGNDPKTADREFTRWSLLGTLRCEGLEAVRRTSIEYKPFKAKVTEYRGYA